jgi:hypothetical protein
MARTARDMVPLWREAAELFPQEMERGLATEQSRIFGTE